MTKNPNLTTPLTNTVQPRLFALPLFFKLQTLSLSLGLSRAAASFCWVFIFLSQAAVPSWVEEVCRNEQVLMAAGGGWPLRAVSRIRVRISPREPRFGLRRKRREKISRAVIHGGKKGSGRFLGPSVQAPGAAVKVLNQFFFVAVAFAFGGFERTS